MIATLHAKLSRVILEAGIASQLLPNRLRAIPPEPGYEIFEYACHEGNYAMRNRLSAAPAGEAREAAAKK